MWKYEETHLRLDPNKLTMRAHITRERMRWFILNLDNKIAAESRTFCYNRSFHSSKNEYTYPFIQANTHKYNHLSFLSFDCRNGDNGCNIRHRKKAGSIHIFQQDKRKEGLDIFGQLVFMLELFCLVHHGFIIRGNVLRMFFCIPLSYVMGDFFWHVKYSHTQRKSSESKKF